MGADETYFGVIDRVPNYVSSASTTMLPSPNLKLIPAPIYEPLLISIWLASWHPSITLWLGRSVHYMHKLT